MFLSVPWLPQNIEKLMLKIILVSNIFPDAGKDWGQKERGVAEDEMVR